MILLLREMMNTSSSALTAAAATNLSVLRATLPPPPGLLFAAKPAISRIVPLPSALSRKTLLSSFAAEFMGTRVWGDITIGLLLGLGQFVTTFAITMAYVSYANRRVDPLSAEIRGELEKQEAKA